MRENFKKVKTTLVVLAMLLSIATVTFVVFKEEMKSAQAAEVYWVDSAQGTTIQSVIDKASAGSTIYVKYTSAWYNESLDIYKPLTIIGLLTDNATWATNNNTAGCAVGAPRRSLCAL